MKSSFKRSFKTWHWLTVCILLVSIVGFVSSLRSHAQSGSTYTITDLGTLGGSQSRATGINNCGIVVGDSYPAGSTSNHPFYSKGGINTDIGTLGGDGAAYAINSFGAVVGNRDTGSGIQRAFLWQDVNADGIATSGELRDFLPAGSSGIAFDVNDAGHVVGVIDAGGVDGTAFEWDSNPALSDVQTLQADFAYGINNAGNIVGTASSHAFIRKGGVYIDLGTFGGTSSGQKISNNDHVVGFSGVGNTTSFHAFVWMDSNNNNSSDAGEMRDLGTLGGSSSFAYDINVINSTDYIVGAAYVANQTSHAFIWHDDNANGVNDPGEMKDLNGQFSDAAWTTLVEAHSINDGGQIVGWGTKSNGETHAFLLTPAGFTPPACPGATPSPSPTPTPATTSLISVQGTGTYRGTATLSATLYSNDMPVFGKTISFTLNSTAVCGGSTGVTCPTTNASGIATLSGVSLSGLDVGNYPAAVGASFAGDSSYGSASQNGLLSVTPFLLLESGSNNAAAVDSVTFVRGPFSVTNNFNFSADHLTRIIIFTSPLANPEPTLKVFASGHELQVESFGAVTGVMGLNVSYIVVKLDPILTGSGPINYDLTVSLRGVTSSTATLTISP